MHLTVTRNIPGAPDHVWGILRTFGLDYLKGFPYQLTGAGVGAERSFQLPDGEMVERVTHFDDAGMSLSYEMVRGPWPVANYLATIRVAAAGPASEVTWSAVFEPASTDENAAAQLVEGTIRMNLRQLEKMFSA